MTSKAHLSGQNLDNNNKSKVSSNESRPWKRVHRHTPENERSSNSNNQQTTKRLSMDAQSSFANRRRSAAHRAPLGPRPPDFSPSKRITSDASTIQSNSSSNRSYIPSAVSESYMGLSNKRNPSTNEAQRSTGNGFVRNEIGTSTPLDFDMMQDSATRPEPNLDDFPRPMGLSMVQPLNSSRSAQLQTQRSMEMELGIRRNGSPAISASTRSPARSPVRQGNAALRAAQLSTIPTSDSVTSTPLVVRTRRQSQFPPSVAANFTSAKAPRKSIGPGFTVPTAREKTAFDPATRSMVPVNRETTTASINRKPSNGASTTKPRSSAGSTPVAWAKTESNPRMTRNLKAQSIHDPISPPSSTRKPFGKASAVDGSQNVGAGNKYSVPKSSFPSATASRRQSITSPHVGGLGARTISPTDARRSKRMSTIDGPPPLPGRSPTPDFSFGRKPSPSPLTPPPRKSLTPTSSSNRATPDPNHVSGFGRPLSSRSSYNTARPPSTSSIQSRPSFSLPSNRSSFSRPRTHSSAAIDPEIVPPVPAIPKAYESPDASKDQPFFNDVMNALSVEARPDPNRPSRGSVFHNEISKSDRPRTSGLEASTKGFDFGNLHEIARAPVKSAGAKEPLQQKLRLPPLNLLPLSTPTTARIASFSTRLGDDTSQDEATPPPRAGRVKTPSTPLTASKATFPTFESQQPLDSKIRSNTSYGNQRPETMNMDGSETESPANFTSDSPNPWKSSSPFTVATTSKAQDLPKSSEDFGTMSSTHKWRSSKPGTPNNGHTSRNTKEVFVTPSTTPNDLENNTNNHSLRRKLSFGWRRSSSKASHTSQHIEDDGNLPPQQNNMPPPKIPTPTTQRRNTLKKNPKASTSSVTVKPTESDTPRNTPATNSARNTIVEPSAATNGMYSSQTALPASRSSTSLLSRISNRASHGNLKSQPSSPKLDQDDLAAEAEMKRLASKKKDFEISAKELDELKRRAIAKERISASQASRNANLNIFERGEIIDYKDVYFCGLKNAKKFVGDLSSSASNFGFDDERGDYNIVIGDHLSYRYEVVDILGKGSFGQVVRCIDHKNGRLVAVKIIRNKKRFHQQALVEVNILQRLREWDPADRHSMITFTQSFYFRGHLCISTELLGMNLYEFIKAHDFTGFSLKLIRRFAKQMLSSLSLLQTHSVIHCDLKPENILLSHPLRSEIKTIDFGSSCFETEKVYTYIQSRFYRSPEVILGMTYGMPIDMWSLGCILAELLTGYPIFPGENEQEQLACIMEVFGPPEKHLIEKSSRKKLFFDSLGKPRITVSSKGKRRRPSSKTLSQALKCDDESFLDFISRCLRWDPDRRLKPDEAMRHDFITGIRRGPRARSQTTAATATSSPAKRPITSRTPSKARALPEPPPATSYKTTAPVTPRAVPPSNSPVKSTIASRRKSTAYVEPPLTSMKRTSNGQLVGSALPRVIQQQRSFSGKPDLASAAAIASLVSLEFPSTHDNHAD